MKDLSKQFRTWIEIDRRAAHKNCEIFRKIIGPKVKLWAVVKSNAYGHGLMVFSKVASDAGVDGFCVDSLVEGLRLRKEGIKKFLLVLGPTLLNKLSDAAKNDVTVSVSHFESLKAVISSPNPPLFHLKIDTGMHRQGFYVEDLPKVVRALQRSNAETRNCLKGLYTHFASAKDINYPTYTEIQFQKFQNAIRIFERAGFRNLMRHCAATGATLIDKKYHQDAVRLGIGLYGLWPSKELEIQMPKTHLKPVLSWRAIVSEVKFLAPGDYVGYDLIERVNRPTKMVILPIGYWHGFPRSLSQIGEVLIHGKRARVLGRVSMDLLTVDATGVNCRIGDIAALIGRDSTSELGAYEVALKSGTTHYEFLTRLNPLMERTVR